jgi:hypothetical protein
MADPVSRGFSGNSGNVRSLNFYNVATDPGSVAANTTLDVDIACVGAEVGDTVSLSLRTALDAGLALGGARVKSSGVVTYRLINATAGAIDPAANVADVVVHRL